MFAGYTNEQRRRHNKTAKPLNAIVLNKFRRCFSILKESKYNEHPSVRGLVGKSTTVDMVNKLDIDRFSWCSLKISRGLFLQ